jgi:8-oxo-dGTP pyrophosphatase MutT (NUDIX family)
MPHIHTEPGQIDFVANIFIVHKNKVLYRYHDKYHKWLMPGGHIEVNEVPEQSAVREAFEEVGLEVKLYNPTNMNLVGREEDPEQIGKTWDERPLLLPVAMDIHSINEQHRHIGLVYFATSETDEIKEPEGREKSGGCVWLTKEEIVGHPGLSSSMKNYGLKALQLLGEWK